MQEEQQELLHHSSVRRRLKSWLLSANYSHSFLRGIVMSISFATYSVIVTAVVLMRETIQRGELPWYTIDALIIGVSFLEAVVAPVIAWAGWRRRRTAMMVWIVPTVIAALTFFAVPSVTSSNSTEFCILGSVMPTPSTSSSSAIARLVLLLIMCLVASLTMTAILCHGIGYMAEHKLEGLISPFGVLMMARVLGFQMFSKLLEGGMNPSILVVLICVSVIIHLIQLLKVPEIAPPAQGTVAPPQDGRGVLASVGRVLSNKVAMTLIFAMAFNAAALWGFAYYENDVIKVNYLQTYAHSNIDTQADIFRYHVVILVVFMVAMKYSSPLLPSFTRGPVLKMSSLLTVTAVPIYVALALMYCSQGSVAGLGPSGYTQPQCSAQCICDSTKNTYAPVCVVEQMTTYLSPCHAGCSEGPTANGLAYLSGCICTSGSGRALNGSCSASGCRDVFEYHKLLLLVVITLTVTVLQLLGAAAIHAVDSRDRAVVVGVMSMVTSFVVFVAGHSIFFSIGTSTCVWFEAGACQLHSPVFPYLIGGVAAAFALVAAIICIVAYFFLSDKAEKKEEQNDLAM